MAAVASDIQINTVKGINMSKAIVIDRLRTLFTASGIPCKSRHHVWERLRVAHPEVCQLCKYTDGRDAKRILWTTVANLQIWHAGCVDALTCCRCSLPVLHG
jgi:hypothetical protein